MNRFLWIAEHLYTIILHLSPKPFRLEFADEMKTVFGEATEGAAECGWVALLACLVREIRDGSALVLQEGWVELHHRIHGGMRKQFDPDLSSQPVNQGSRTMTESDRFLQIFREDRRLASIAAMPPLLFGLGVAIDSLIRGGPWNTVPTWRLWLSVGAGLFPMLIIAVVGLYAVSRRMPIWGLTWIGSGYMGLLLLVKTASEELADVGRYIVSQSADIVLVVIVLVAGLVLLGYASARGWRQAGLFSIGMSTVFCLSLYLSVTSAPFYRHDLALISAPIGLLLALLTYGYLIGSDRIRALSFISVAVINLSPVLITNHVWRDWLQRENRPSMAIPLMVLLVVSLASGPVMGALLNPLTKIINRAS